MSIRKIWTNILFLATAQRICHQILRKILEESFQYCIEPKLSLIPKLKKYKFSNNNQNSSFQMLKFDYIYENSVQDLLSSRGNFFNNSPTVRKNFKNQSGQWKTRFWIFMEALFKNIITC